MIGHLEEQSWTDNASGAQRSRAVIVASQVLFLDYDRARPGQAELLVAEEQSIEEVV